MLSRFAFLRPRPKDPAELQVAHAGDVLRVRLRRSASARRLTLRVSTATGEVLLTIPEGVALPAAQRFADAHAGWIAARLARLPGRVAFAPGVTVPLRGAPHRIALQEGLRGATRAALDGGGNPVIAVWGDPAHAGRRVRDFLQREARRDLEAAVARHAAALGVKPARIALRDTASRWGSCSSRGNLNFSWRLILAPAFVLDYLAAHEVAHLREMNHSERFWRLVGDLCPATDEAERWLKRHGAELHRYG